MTARPIGAAVARRFLALRHLLAPPRSLPPAADSVMTVFERLGSLQFDPLEVAGRNHDLVLHSRVAGYRRAWTDGLLYTERRLFEAYNKGLSLLPTSELPWFRITWDRGHAHHSNGTFSEHDATVEAILRRIRAEGPLSSLDFERQGAIEWYWGPTGRTRAVLEALAEAGVLGLARREGNRRYYDLIERLYPPELLDARRPERDQLRHKLLSRYRAHGLLGRSGSAELWYGIAPARPAGRPDDVPTRARLLDELVEREELAEVEVEGLRGSRFVVVGELALLDQAEREVASHRDVVVVPASVDSAASVSAGIREGPGLSALVNGRRPGVALMAPLDPLVWDRDLLRRLYAFDYVWEVYVPAAKRRWGYYVLPILFGDCFVGRIEPRIDRRDRVVRILGLWWEPGFDPFEAPGFVDAFADALEAFRAFGKARRVVFPRDRRAQALARALRATH